MKSYLHIVGRLCQRNSHLPILDMLRQLHLTPNLKIGRPHLMLPQSIQYRLEIIEENRIGQTLEDERKLPERINASHVKDRRDRQDVQYDERDAETHA